MFQLYFFRRPVLMALAVYCVGIFAFKRAGYWARPPDDDPARWINERGAVTGVISAHPDARPTGCVYRVEVEMVEIFQNAMDPGLRQAVPKGYVPAIKPIIERYGATGRKRHAANGQMLVQVMNSTAPIAAPGDRVRAVGQFQKPRSSLIPGTFDYQDYLANQGVGTVMYTSSRSFENIGASGGFKLTRWGWKLKQEAVRIFDAGLDPEQSTVLAGMAVGNRPRFSAEIRRIFIESGTMHVLVASGSNVAFVMALWFFLARLFRIPNRWALGSALPAVWMYVLVAGADAPIARAGLMGTIGVLGFLFNREDRPYQALGLTAFIILILTPRALFDIGFQMSFGTVFGLIYFLSPAEKFIQATPFWSRWPLRLLAATLSAQIWIAPITAAVFQRFFPVSVLSNLLVVPLAALGLTAGLAVGAVEWMAFLKTPVLFLTRGYLSLLIGLVRFFADHPGWSIWVAPPHPLSAAGFYTACFAVVGLKGSVACRVLFAGGLGLMLTGAVVRHCDRPEISSLTVHWIDTGRRLTTLVESGDGKKILINPGPQEPADTTERVLMPFLTRRGIRSLDAVFITDPDPLRTAGVASLMRWVQVSTVVHVNAPALWVSDGNNTLLILDRPTTKVQRALLSVGARSPRPTAGTAALGGVIVVQTHFPRNWIWLPEFLERFKPELLVETFAVSEFRPSVPPWTDIPSVAPQNTGWRRWPNEN